MSYTPTTEEQSDVEPRVGQWLVTAVDPHPGRPLTAYRRTLPAVAFEAVSSTHQIVDIEPVDAGAA